MINFGVKVLEPDVIYTDSYEAWYTEMLSMLAEDVIGPLVGIPYVPANPNGNVIVERIHSRWLKSYYNFGVMSWDNASALDYYASNYAFGAYLVRNFGGPELLSRIAKSGRGGRTSLDKALKELNGAKVDSSYALSRFGEVLVYSGDSMPASVLSFDKVATGKVGTQTYTFPRFNIWTMGFSGESAPPAGPTILPYTNTPSNNANSGMPPYSVQLFSKDEWRNKSGTLTVDVYNGRPSGIYYVMVK
jgi:hypothetical protein